MRVSLSKTVNLLPWPEIHCEAVLCPLDHSNRIGLRPLGSKKAVQWVHRHGSKTALILHLNMNLPAHESQRVCPIDEECTQDVHSAQSLILSERKKGWVIAVTFNSSCCKNDIQVSVSILHCT